MADEVATARKLTRRAFMKGVAGSAAGLALYSTVGFSQSEPMTFTHTYADQLVTLDPAATHTHMDWEIILQVYDRLVQYDGPSLSKLKPMLSTEVPSLANGLISEDGLTYTFPIREGVQFHDGSELTAEDVAYTFRRMIVMDVPQAKVQDFVLPYLTEDGIEVTDRYTVKLHLTEPFAGFLYSLADSSASIVSQRFVEANGGITPGEENEEMRWKAMGTGPFVLDEIVPPGERIVMLRNENYWDTVPDLDRIVTELVSENSTQILMLKNGEADSIEVGKDQLRNLQDLPNVTVKTGMPAIRSHTIKMQQNINTAEMDSANTIPADFFQDINVRKGFAFAFPYDGYLQTYLEGDARYAGPIPNDMFGDNAQAPMYQFDQDQAADYFKQTEWWEKGFTITMYTLPDWGTWPQAIAMLTQSLKEINPKFVIETRAVQWGTLVDLLNKNAIPIRVGALRGATADPDSIIRNRMYEGGWDGMGLNDPDVNAMIDEAATTLDPEARKAIYAELEQIAYDTAFMLWISQDSGLLVHRDRVKGLYWHPILQHWPSWRDVTIEA